MKQMLVTARIHTRKTVTGKIYQKLEPYLSICGEKQYHQPGIHLKCLMELLYHQINSRIGQ